LKAIFSETDLKRNLAGISQSVIHPEQSYVSIFVDVIFNKKPVSVLINETNLWIKYFKNKVE
jgi:hypothetical protein